MLIGLHGRAQAGKDTAFERISKLYSTQIVERRAFADKLYEAAAESIGVASSVLRALKTEPEATIELSVGLMQVKAVTVREYLQLFGTEGHRSIFGDNFWVDQLDMSHEDGIVCVTDVRFDNEATAIRAAGGYVVHVVGPAEVEAPADGHASEAGLSPDLIDRTVDNSVRGDGFASLDAQLRDVVGTLDAMTIESAR